METLHRLITWAQDTINVPNLLLATVIIVGLWILRKAQDRPEFEIGHMLIDENGKPSSSRFAVFISLGLTSYLLAYVFINKKVSDDTMLYMFIAYIATWASSKAL